MHDNLKKLCKENEKFFNKDTSALGIHLSFDLMEISNNFDELSDLVRQLEVFACEYDFDEKTPGNGYRSCILVFRSAVAYAENVLNDLTQSRDSFFFQKRCHVRKVSTCSQMFECLVPVYGNLIELHKSTASGQHRSESLEDNKIVKALTTLNWKCFLGESVGFQYPASFRNFLKMLTVSCAAYSDFYYSKNSLPSKLFDVAIKSLTYWLNPEKRAEKIFETFTHTDHFFMKSFLSFDRLWMFHFFINAFALKVEVNEVFQVLPEAFELYSSKYEKLIKIPIPTSHIGLTPLKCRLLSAIRRKGMFGERIGKVFADPSKHLIFHVHGGGYIAQSSKTHEIYLREWSTKLEVPIVSVDYSLVPDGRFPRAVEEVFFAYCWVLKHSHLLGWTGESIVIISDSAGSNLAMCCIIKCIEMGIRKPQGFFSSYGTFMTSLSDCFPGRYFGIFDALVNNCNSIKCLMGYSCKTQPVMELNDDDLIKELHEGFFIPESENYLLSPFRTPDEILKEFPPTTLISTTLDALIDETVEMAKKFKKLGVEVHLEILENIAHGFLPLSVMSPEFHEASLIAMELVAKLLHI